ncbi:NUDIX domain-containing protein [Vallitalea guaymasensis]|uniref:inorganic diphosphatase n=1 Tax=Vallitalea guaymasensis TaxID=1185412 RepID=A0A8J8M9G1_9FIRM|nr:NUDIX domain-containing protein [Vallitalea guaymasensis]QUH28565.1 NUDIX domain-containing protein [Vallitalea guaymasensis]
MLYDYLGKDVEVIIDRPLGSKHPRFNMIYPLNYGYIPDTVSGDGQEIDAYVLGVFEPVERYTGKVIAIIRRADDDEDKLVVAQELNSYDKYQIKALTEFTERHFETEIISFEYLKQSIRNTARLIARRDDEILVIKESDDGEVYYHLPGGGIEYREKIEEALEREAFEELGVHVVEYEPFIIFENFFEVKGMMGHEISHIYEVKLSGDIYKINEMDMNADLLPAKVVWVKVQDFKDNIKTFYPTELAKLI